MVVSANGMVSAIVIRHMNDTVPSPPARYDARGKPTVVRVGLLGDR